MFYVPVLSREDTANAQVAEGNIFLFSEDGGSLTAKMSDGSYRFIKSGGSGEDAEWPTLTEVINAEDVEGVVSTKGKLRYIFQQPLMSLTLAEFTTDEDDQPRMSSPYEMEVQFVAADGFTLILPERMALAAGRGVAKGYVEDATYLLNARFGVAIIARIFPDGILEEDELDGQVADLEKRVTALEEAVTGVEPMLSDIIGEEA